MDKHNNREEKQMPVAMNEKEAKRKEKVRKTSEKIDKKYEKVFKTQVKIEYVQAGR